MSTLKKFFEYIVVGIVIGIVYLVTIFVVCIVMMILISNINPDFYPNHEWGFPVTLIVGCIITAYSLKPLLK
jgi:hypothetical protein